MLFRGDERMNIGRMARKSAPRSSHGEWIPSADRLLMLQSFGAARCRTLAASPSAYLRGTPGVFAADLADTPVTGITVQLCGDAHPSAFGRYRGPDRRRVFGLISFDETIPGPWEWDVKRLAAGVQVAAGDRGWTTDQGRRAVRAAIDGYQHAMAEFAGLGELDLFYGTQEDEDLGKVNLRTEGQPRLNQVVSGRVRIKDDPPMLDHALTEDVLPMYHDYLRTLPFDRRRLLDRFTVTDIVRQHDNGHLLLLIGRDPGERVLLRLTTARHSVLEDRLGFSGPIGERMVTGQRLLQAADDPFLGTHTDEHGTEWLWRVVPEIQTLPPDAPFDEFEPFAGLCGRALARAHARGGDRRAIAEYLGTSHTFAEAIATFAYRYANQIRRDHRTLLRAIAAGQVPAAIA
ncbi:DUF2252 domain-containing protein [Pseudonocardiaceae bacterium YIM PH 21723]|nr:DUF2252 domain-containing protein [Pseudonocardiaceae bacterium YIM PH 21723]